MTCKEKLIADHPDWTEERIADFIKKQCPHHLNYLERPDWCEEVFDIDVCSVECWNREIPETEESTEVKKEKENMCACLEFLACKNRVAELEAQLKRLNQTNEDLANKLAREKVCVEKLDNLVKIRDEEIDKLVKELDIIEETRDNMVATIAERDSQLERLNQTNEDLANKLAAERAKNIKLQNMVCDQNEEIDKLVAENNKLNERITAGKVRNDNLDTNLLVIREENKNLKAKIDFLTMQIKDYENCIYKHEETIEGKNKRISELCDRINKMTEDEYIKRDIEATKEIAEKFNSCGNDCAMIPTDIARAVAMVMRTKYDALTYVGFSHDDAMSLIPMWTD